MLKLDSTQISRLMHRQLAERGIAAEAAMHVTSALVEASLRGVDSHGVNLFPHYCASIDAGRINRNPDFHVVEQRDAAAVLDADFGFGHHAGAVAMDMAMDMARRRGIGAVAVRNSSHFAAAAYYGLRAARADLVGMAFTNADALVKAANSTVSFFGTNPICITFPMEGEGPLCLDMATSLVSWNKIVNHRREASLLPDGWAFDAEGHPTVDPDAARSLSPLGGYKGFGLGLMVEMLCAMLADGPLGADLLPMYQGLGERRQVSHFFMAIDVAAFAPVERVRYRVAEMAARVRSLPPAAGHPMIPGDPEKRTEVERRQNGIPMDDAKFAEFLAVSPTFNEAAIA